MKKQVENLEDLKDLKNLEYSDLVNQEHKRISIDISLSTYVQLQKIAWLECRTTKSQAQLLISEKIKDTAKSYKINENEN